MTDTANTSKPQRVRSPGYPGSTLQVALERAQLLYDKAARHPLPYRDVLTCWGFKATTSGNAAVAYAALKKYGLLVDDGKGDQRQGRLTDLALNALNVNPNQKASIQKAALSPLLMREWWGKYRESGLPPEATLRFDYVVHGKFTQGGLDEFVRIYKANVSFAELDPAATLSPDVEGETPEDNDDGEEETPESNSSGGRTPPRLPKSRLPEGSMTYMIPVAMGENVLIEGQFPLSEEKWHRLQSVLEAMKPSLVGEPAPEPIDEN